MADDVNLFFDSDSEDEFLVFTGEDVEASRLRGERAAGDGGDRVDSDVSISDVSSWQVGKFLKLFFFCNCFFSRHLYHTFSKIKRTSSR